MGYRIPNTKPTDEQKAQMKQAVIKLIEEMGGLTNAAKALGVKMLVLNGWRTRGRIPAYQADKISRKRNMKAKGFTREFMRPDVNDWS